MKLLYPHLPVREEKEEFCYSEVVLLEAFCLFWSYLLFFPKGYLGFSSCDFFTEV